MDCVLITGATGFIGLELARLCAGKGMNPRLLVRRLARGPLLAGLEAELVAGDLEAPASLERAARGVDVIFHLAARATFEPYERLRPSIVDGSLALLETAARSGLKTFVYASSLMVYGPQDKPIDEQTPATPVVDYGRAKLEAETALARRCRTLGVRFCALRLPHVYGVQDAMFAMLRRGWLVCPGPGTNAYGHLHVQDAARALLACAESCWEGVSAIGDQFPATFREFFAVMDAHLPHHKRLMLPKWLAYLGVSLLWPWQKISSRPTLHTRDGVTTWNMPLPVQPGLGWEPLGVRPLFPTIHEGVPAVLDDCLSFRWVHPLSDRR